jgi:hypothetical protein
MESAKIRVRIGDNEFEAEGPAELVQQQFEAFKEIIRLAPDKSKEGKKSYTAQTVEGQLVAEGIPILTLENIMHVSGRIVSLTALPTTTEDAALLIMFGHKELKQSASVTAQEIGDGLAQSGRPVPRVDRVMEAALEQALVLKTGVKRSTKYRLTNQGVVKAQSLASELLATLP